MGAALATTIGWDLTVVVLADGLAPGHCHRNTTYQASQCSTDLTSIAAMLQGLNNLVNVLSRILFRNETFLQYRVLT